LIFAGNIPARTLNILDAINQSLILGIGDADVGLRRTNCLLQEKKRKTDQRQVYKKPGFLFLNPYGQRFFEKCCFHEQAPDFSAY
jgi:hypothetical protein